MDHWFVHSHWMVCDLDHEPNRKPRYTKQIYTKQLGWINKLFSPAFKNMDSMDMLLRFTVSFHVKKPVVFLLPLRRFSLTSVELKEIDLNLLTSKRSLGNIWSTSPNLLLLQQFSCLDRGWPFATWLDRFSIWKFRFQNAIAYKEITAMMKQSKQSGTISIL